MRSKILIAFATVVALMALFGGFATAGPAKAAASLPRMTQAQALAKVTRIGLAYEQAHHLLRPASYGCSGEGCDGKDNAATGCNKAPGTWVAGNGAAKVEFIDSSNYVYYVELWWSPGCYTNWTYTHRGACGANDGNTMSAYVYRQDGLQYYAISSSSACGVSSPMVYARSMVSQACGYLGDLPPHYCTAWY